MSLTEQVEQAYYATWSRDRIDKRINLLARRVRTSVSLDTRALLRAEIDALLEERHRRWPGEADDESPC